MNNNANEEGLIWGELIAYLSGALGQAVSEGDRVIYIDYPVHSNVGDLLIYLGTEKWFLRHNLDVIGHWHMGNFPFSKIDKDVVILCHGGGNFGDLYEHQGFRERVVAAYPENRIIFLPQTIHYKSIDRFDAAAKILNCHSDLHIFTRDKKSLSLAEEKLSGCKTYIAPDMATFLYPITKGLGTSIYCPSPKGTLCLMRNDIESPINIGCAEDSCAWKGDWNDILTWRKYIFLVFRKFGSGLKYTYPTQVYSDYYRRYAASVVEHCVIFFSQYEKVITSRLHGHILASLMDKPNIVIDNIYGKNSSYFDAWHSRIPNTQLRR